MKLSVLDQSPISQGEGASQAIAYTITLAQRCDELGYHRYWLAEHHTSKLACPAPEVLIARIAHETTRLRVGSGGIMLSHYSPLKVAESFKLLEAMYPGRIDLGVGRAPGCDQVTAAALAYGNRLGIEYYPAKVKDLLAWVSGGKPFTEEFKGIKVTPKTSTVPEVWILASTLDSALYAAQLGLPLSFAHFIASTSTVEVMQTYRREFKPEYLTKPYTSVGVFAIAHEDPNCLAQLPVEHSGRIIGTPAQVKTEIDALVDASGADEVVILTITPSFEDRLRSYELIAAEYSLSSAPAPVTVMIGPATAGNR